MGHETKYPSTGAERTHECAVSAARHPDQGQNILGRRRNVGTRTKDRLDPRIIQELIILLPCHSLEDFPLHHEGEDAEGLLASWTALW